MADNDSGSALFDSLSNQTRQHPLTYRGEPLPDWLRGTFIRNGPAQFRYGRDAPMNHLFDGAAMLHAFRFRDGGISYSNQFLQSQDYRLSSARQRLMFTEFGTAPRRSLLQKLRATILPSSQFGGNNSVNVIEHDGSVLAISDAPVPHRISAADATTLGTYPYRGMKLLMIDSPHPLWDRDRGEQINVGLRPDLNFKGNFAAYSVFRVRDGSRRREPIARIPVPRPAYLHSFALTERYVILTEHPDYTRIDKLLTLALHDRALRDAFSWQPRHPSRFIIVDRDSGREVRTLEVDPFFLFHHCNAFERDGRIHVDLIRYPDNGAVEAFELRHLRRFDPASPQARSLRAASPRRYSIDPVSGAVTQRALSDIALEMPSINFDYSRRPYRYVYGSGFSGAQACFFDRLVKLDVGEVDDGGGQTAYWGEPNCYVSAPRFVPAPTAGAPAGRPEAEADSTARLSDDGHTSLTPDRREDRGVVLSVIFDAERGRSFLLILDAASFVELGRADLPHAVPWGLHGLYTELH